MKKKRKFDDILNECIERVLRGESIEACLASYPELSAELEPLLLTAMDTIKAAAIAPRPEFRQRAGLEFQAAIHDLKLIKHGFFVRQFRWVAVVSAVIVILLAGSGTVAAASNSLPDEPLYTVKLATEDVRLTLTTSELGKAKLYAEFADRRVNEIIKMAEKGKVAKVLKATDRMNDQLAAMAHLSLESSQAEATGGETPSTLMAAPASGTTAAPTVNVPAMTPAPSPTPTPGVIAAPAPVTKHTENGKDQTSSANISSAKGAERPPVTVITRAKKVVKIKSQADLKMALSEQAEENKQELQDILDRAPDSVKAALERAIEVAGKGYDEAMKNMERKKY